MMHQYVSLLWRSPWVHTPLQTYKSTSRLILFSLMTPQPSFKNPVNKIDSIKVSQTAMFSTSHHLSNMYTNNIGKLTKAYMIQVREFRSTSRRPDPWNRNPFQANDLMSKVKTGALVLLGTGALVASTSLAFGFIMTGAAGFGLYNLYQKFRTRVFSDVFRSEPRDLSELYSSRRRKSQTSSYSEKDQLDQLFTDVPVLIRPILRGIFSLAGGAMEQSMERARIMREEINQRLECHPRIAQTVGNDVEVSAPTQWSQSSLNGVGTIEAMFPVARLSLLGHVQARASVDTRGQLTFRSLTFHNIRTKETIDLLNQDFNSFRRSNRNNANNTDKRRIMDAEYKER